MDRSIALIDVEKLLKLLRHNQKADPQTDEHMDRQTNTIIGHMQLVGP